MKELLFSFSIDVLIPQLESVNDITYLMSDIWISMRM